MRGNRQSKIYPPEVSRKFELLRQFADLNKNLGLSSRQKDWLKKLPSEMNFSEAKISNLKNQGGTEAEYRAILTYFGTRPDSQFDNRFGWPCEAFFDPLDAGRDTATAFQNLLFPGASAGRAVLEHKVSNLNFEYDSALFNATILQKPKQEGESPSDAEDWVLVARANVVSCTPTNGNFAGVEVCRYGLPSVTVSIKLDGQADVKSSYKPIYLSELLAGIDSGAKSERLPTGLIREDQSTGAHPISWRVRPKATNQSSVIVEGALIVDEFQIEGTSLDDELVLTARSPLPKIDPNSLPSENVSGQEIPDDVKALFCETVLLSLVEKMNLRSGSPEDQIFDPSSRAEPLELWVSAYALRRPKRY